MSASLVVLLPLMLLGIVSVFCFVGCAFQSGGVGIPFTQYSGLTVRGNSNLLAYWPLDDAIDTAAAKEFGPNNLEGQFPGEYVDMNTVSALYPLLPSSPPNPPGANVQSAGAPGMLNLGQPGLVKGDVQPGTNPPSLTTCMVVNGGYVLVGFDNGWNPTSSFTIEAWVAVMWQSTDTPALRAVLDGRGQNQQGPPICQGFALIALPDDGQTMPPFTYHWAVMVGNGAEDFITLIDSGQAIKLFVPGLDDQLENGPPAYYLAATYESSMQILTLYVSDVSGTTTSTTATPPPPTPNPLYTTNTASPLYIGAGAPYLIANQPSGVPPLFPFHGAIQDVAIYNISLTAAQIAQNFTMGRGFL
jgi:hypothetical protein